MASFYTGGDHTQEVYSPEGIAFDWISKKIYWSDAAVNRIFSMKLDRTHRVTVMITERPRSIALDPCRGLVSFCAVSSVHINRVLFLSTESLNMITA